MPSLRKSLALMKIPVFKTKDPGVLKSFDLRNPLERKEYFEAKAGLEIAKIRGFLENNTFVVYLMGKKGSGKGTRAKMFKEIFGEDRVAHISVGDLVRSVHKAIKTPEGKKSWWFTLRRIIGGIFRWRRELR